MKNKQMKSSQQGFTLIELVVVIVILGILAATAVPKFSSLQNNANKAVADGIAGAIVSAAVIQYGVNNGAASTIANIKSNVDASTAYTTSIDGGCAGTTETFTVTESSGSQTSSSATMPAGLCSG